mmetsp:Transcript_28446/g.83136  ORF Transcript_28446/g.83136 Transcript_28446/m.83136 type:complete len:313 (+) Transcript_28446:1896-2834(+)
MGTDVPVPGPSPHSTPRPLASSLSTPVLSRQSAPIPSQRPSRPSSAGATSRRKGVELSKAQGAMTPLDLVRIQSTAYSALLRKMTDDGIDVPLPFEPETAYRPVVASGACQRREGQVRPRSASSVEAAAKQRPRTPSLIDRQKARARSSPGERTRRGGKKRPASRAKGSKKPARDAGRSPATATEMQTNADPAMGTLGPGTGSSTASPVQWDWDSKVQAVLLEAARSTQDPRLTNLPLDKRMQVMLSSVGSSIHHTTEQHRTKSELQSAPGQMPLAENEGIVANLVVPALPAAQTCPDDSQLTTREWLPQST